MEGPDIDDTTLSNQFNIDPKEETWYRWGIFRKPEDGSGKFYEKFNPEHGVFIAVNNNSGKKDSELGRFSNATWLGWKTACENEEIEPGTLKYMLQHTIINGHSKAIISEVFVRYVSYLYHPPLSCF